MFLVLAACAVPLSAHVGSPDVFLEGNAGPYKLFVTVRVPQVIPGIAEIEIRSESERRKLTFASPPCSSPAPARNTLRRRRRLHVPKTTRSSSRETFG